MQRNHNKAAYENLKYVFHTSHPLIHFISLYVSPGRWESGAFSGCASEDSGSATEETVLFHGFNIVTSLSVSWTKPIFSCYDSETYFLIPSWASSRGLSWSVIWWFHLVISLGRTGDGYCSWHWIAGWRAGTPVPMKQKCCCYYQEGLWYNSAVGKACIGNKSFWFCDGYW